MRVGAHIGALVVPELVVEGEDAALGVECGADLVALLARMVGADEMLAAVLDPFHRAREPHRRDADQHVLGIDLAANAEAAADMGFVHMDRRRAAPEHVGEQVAVAMRHLGGAMQFEDVARGVVAADGAARLQRHAAVPADGKIELDHRLGAREHGVDVAIALADDGRLGVAAGRELAGLRIGVEQHRQLGDVDRRRGPRRPPRHRDRSANTAATGSPT